MELDRGIWMGWNAGLPVRTSPWQWMTSAVVVDMLTSCTLVITEEVRIVGWR